MNARGKVGQLIKKDQSDIEWGEDGAGSGTVTYYITPKTLAIQKAPRVRTDTHPDDSRLVARRNRVRFADGGAYIVTSYEGIVQEPGGKDEVEVVVSPTLREAPITTHPKFSSWAGTPANPNEAVFDPDGRFASWAPDSDLLGQDTWLIPSVEVTLSYFSRREPNLSQLGTIISSKRNLPKVGQRDWLVTGIPYRSVGQGSERGFNVSESYLMSGIDGWNKRVYRKG